VPRTADGDRPRVPRVWSLTTGETGSRQQARGLARELSTNHEERVVRVSRFAALAPSGLFSLTLAGVRAVEGAIAPPWPDVVVSCGRRAGLAALAIRRRNPAPMVLIHVQPPKAPDAFDLVVVLPHDRLEGPNVLRVDTALHGLRATDLSAAAAAGDPRFTDLPRPWTGVLVGGPTSHAPFSVTMAQRLADHLDALRAETGGSLLITPSRRTPPDVLAALAARYNADLTAFFWDGGGANPYRTILAGADTLVTTGDSISMISEALATTADVWVFDTEGGERHGRFLRSLFDKRLAARLGGPPPVKRPVGLDATPIAAAAARELIRAKLGLVS
jgi:mitochondrial fission protein ELM1